MGSHMRIQEMTMFVRIVIINGRAKETGCGQGHMNNDNNASRVEVHSSSLLFCSQATPAGGLSHVHIKNES